MSATAPFVITRSVGAPRARVWQTWTQVEHLRHWWGPKGFTNTFHEFDLRPGGDWRFVMHGPNGTDYANHNVFVEVVKPERVVFDHVSRPPFQMAIALAAAGPGKTTITWRMRFATAALLRRGVAQENIFLSMERNMKCALGFCGHCQLGSAFLCKDGPVLRFDRLLPWLSAREV